MQRPAAARGRWYRRPRLALEIGIALAIKFALLVVLHQLWFAHPQSKLLTDAGVAEVVLGVTAGTPPQPAAEERRHGSGP